MHPLGHTRHRRPAGPGSKSLTILQTQALHSPLGRGHVSAGRSGLPCPVGLTLTLGRFLRLLSPVACPGSLAVWGHLMRNGELWVPLTWKLYHLAPCGTKSPHQPQPPPSLPGGRHLHTPERPSHLRRAPTPKIPEPDGPPDQNPPRGPPQGLTWHWHVRPATLPEPNPNPRWRVQDLDPRGLTPNSSPAWQPRADGRTQPLGQEQSLSLDAVYSLRSGRRPRAPLRLFPLSLPLQAPNPGPEAGRGRGGGPESRPPLRPWGRPCLCGQIRQASSLRHQP